MGLIFSNYLEAKKVTAQCFPAFFVNILYLLIVCENENLFAKSFQPVNQEPTVGWFDSERKIAKNHVTLSLDVIFIEDLHPSQTPYENFFRLKQIVYLFKKNQFGPKGDLFSKGILKIFYFSVCIVVYTSFKIMKTKVLLGRKL